MGRKTSRTSKQCESYPEWTEGKFQSFIKSILRSGSQRWPPKYKVLNEAKRGKKINEATGRMAEHYECAGCGSHFPAKCVVVDHILPVVPIDGFTSWDDVIYRMFCPVENLQVLCKECHKNVKTRVENEERRTIASIRETHEREYQTWSNMNDRCTNPKATVYKYYGEKGISVCERWLRDGTSTPLKNFIEDMGDRPEGKTLDRVDFRGDYNKENCRWADSQEQARNTSFNNWIEYDGEFKILQEWGEELGIIPNTILTRLKRGWSIGQALGKEERPKPTYSGRLTVEDINCIQDMLNSGMSQVAIGKHLEMDASSISRICTKFGIKANTKNNNKAEND